ncbi:MAG: hypothetical protein HY343_02785 [Lentisphaerae bacterium]|nr:hypothetical protein [Lentisphaerota bacterium]
MKSQSMGLKVAGTVFALMSLAQLVRLAMRADVLVAGHPLPLWPSALAFVILGGLSLWLWKFARMPYIFQERLMGLKVAGTVFGLMSLVHLARLAMRFDVLVAGHPVPVWASAPIFLVLGGLSFWLWKLARTPIQVEEQTPAVRYVSCLIIDLISSKQRSPLTLAKGTPLPRLQCAPNDPVSQQPPEFDDVVTRVKRMAGIKGETANGPARGTFHVQALGGKHDVTFDLNEQAGTIVISLKKSGS